MELTDLCFCFYENLGPWNLPKRRRREEEGFVLAKFFPPWCVLTKANIPSPAHWRQKRLAQDCMYNQEEVAWTVHPRRSNRVSLGQTFLGRIHLEERWKGLRGTAIWIKRCLYTSLKICSVRFTEHGHHVIYTIQWASTHVETFGFGFPSLEETPLAPTILEKVSSIPVCHQSPHNCN